MQATYTHDNLGRLTQIVFDNGRQVTYNFDAVGNRTSVVRVGPPPTVDDPSNCLMRVSLTQGDPWGRTDVTNGTTLYIEPIYDGGIGIWNGSATNDFEMSAFSLSLAGLTAQNFRLYVYDSNEDAVIDSAELVAWANSTTPPSDTLVADGYLVKTAMPTRRAVADIMLHATGQCDWRDARRGICHIDERSRRLTRLTAFPANDSWAVNGPTTWRLVAGGTSVIGQHFVEFILSNSTYVSAESKVLIDKNGAGSWKYEFGIGIDSPSANSATQSFGHDNSIGSGMDMAWPTAVLKDNVLAGKRVLNMLEQNTTIKNVTAYGDNADVVFKSGMIVEIML
ncbi:MAG: RHS repeat protein [Candidatus Obscuribacterales bacterium]|nr:RHS repeat protein [Candidatus Obscuribacterales bacterium]